MPTAIRISNTALLTPSEAVTKKLWGNEPRRSSPTLQSVDEMQLDKALARYTNQVAHVVVRNHARSKDFSQLEASPAMDKLRALSGAVVDLPELDASAMYKMDMGGLSYWAGAHVNEGETALKPLERERVKLWLMRAYAELDKLGHAI